MIHTLPKLGYSYDALEPYIDARTMELHHTKHHQTYIDKLNTALGDYPDFQEYLVDEEPGEARGDLAHGLRRAALVHQPVHFLEDGSVEEVRTAHIVTGEPDDAIGHLPTYPQPTISP